jgi:hypothetical protein
MVISGVHRGTRVDGLSEVTEVRNGILRLAEVGVHDGNLVALPLDELCVRGLAIRAAVISTSTTDVQLMELLKRVVGGHRCTATTTRSAATGRMVSNLKRCDKGWSGINGSK